MTTVASKHFVDTNVLVFATIGSAPHHAEARLSLDRLRHVGHELWISRQVLREYIATVTRPQTYMRPLPVTVVQAAVVRFQTDFNIAEDGSAVTTNLLGLLGSVPCGGKQIHDANIVSTMLVHNIYYLLTDNTTDFARFAGLINVIPLVHPTPPAPPALSAIPPPPPGAT